MMEELEILLNQDQDQDPLEGILVDQERMEQEQEMVRLLLVERKTSNAGGNGARKTQTNYPVR
jgi:hypothetical protein